LRTGQNLCRNAIEKYYGADALARFKRKTEESRSKLSQIFENLIWKDLRDTLSELVEKDDEKQLGKYAPVSTETEDIVKIYEKTEDGNYLWGKCPKCKTLFDYDRSYINKTLRCRVCNAPMKLIKAN
jgi:phage FluMu protein Com